MIFRDRFDGGRRLGEQLLPYRRRKDVLVLGLPRGGVPVAYEVARALEAPLDLFLVRKLGVPGHEELAMGAIASGGVVVLNDDVVRALRIPPHVIEAVASSERRELEKREKLYRGNRESRRLAGRTLILVDDGLATGASMRAAVAAVRGSAPEKIVVGVPVAAADTCSDLGDEADEVVCVATPEPFYAVGMWYRDFSQTTDEEVTHLLEKAERWSGPVAA